MDIAVDIFLKTRKPETICGVVTDAGREGEDVVITTLGELKNCEVGMRSLVLIGSEKSVVINGKFIMPRGYDV